MEIFLQILDYINIFFIAITLMSSIIQVVYMIAAFFCKKTTFKEAEIKHKICVLIPAHNESKSIKKLIEDLQTQQYPKEQYDIVVIAHNCTDNTADIARECGVIAFECKSKEKLKGMALKLAVDEYLQYDYEIYVVLDADCRVESNYLSKMNDAFHSGVHIARSYLGSVNAFDNSLSCVSSLYNVRDERITARVREKAKLSAQLIGNSFFMSKQLLEEFGTFPSYDSLAEDADFMVKCMLKKYRIHYVEDAICYTGDSTKVSELFKRNMRIGHGVNKVFWKNGYKLIGKFFTTFNFSYLDIFFTMAFLPISFISCIWFPAYYIFLILKMIITKAPVLHMAMLMDLQSFWPMAIVVVLGMVLLLTLQGVITVFLQKDRLLKEHKWKDYAKALLLMCPIMLVTNVAITCGILNPKQDWKTIERATDSRAENLDSKAQNCENTKDILIAADDISADIIEDNEKNICNEGD